MITKTIEPIINLTNESVIGTDIQYRIFGLLIYRKTMYSPEKYGIKEYDYSIRI